MHQVAQTIAQQLGGNKFVAMTGATLTSGPDSLSICLGRNRSVVVTLDDDDTYTVALHKPGRFSAKGGFVQPAPIVRQSVYCDQLQSTFTDLTGLLTHL